MEREEVSQDEVEASAPMSQEKNYGFRPLESSAPAMNKVTDTPTCIALRDQINKLLCRYPELAIRSSVATMEELKKYDEEELRNILQNANNDLLDIRGMPAADMVLHMLTSIVERWIPGYMERCLNDYELKRDTESEMAMLLGPTGTRTNMLYRFINNGYECLFQPDKPFNQQRERKEFNDSRKRSYFRDIRPSEGESNESENEESQIEEDYEQEKRPRKRVRTRAPEDSTS
jgi:hypothetical protein